MEQLRQSVPPSSPLPAGPVTPVEVPAVPALAASQQPPATETQGLGYEAKLRAMSELLEEAARAMVDEITEVLRELFRSGDLHTLTDGDPRLRHLHQKCQQLAELLDCLSTEAEDRLLAEIGVDDYAGFRI